MSLQQDHYILPRTLTTNDLYKFKLHNCIKVEFSIWTELKETPF